LSEKYPVPITKTTPMAPLGALMRSAWRGVYPKVVKRMLEKLEIPPFGIELKHVARQTSQTLASLNVSNT